ncbi:MAG: hypothetical protein M3Z31_06810 [Pseudomonadota bacterium]|nr:hypothetical protein [Pseudomonadota bacterium]
MLRLSSWFSAAALLLVSSLACASFHLFQIEEMYSNADGTVQYVVLHEFTGSNGENLLGGQRLSSTDHGGITKSITFPANLPSSATANRRVLIATAGFAALGVATPDYTIPARFLPVDGGTLNYANVDQVSFASLPTDGMNAAYRGNTVGGNVARNFAGTAASAPATAVGAVEFYNAALNHYFISALAPDIDALDSGRIAGWARTGESFKVFPSQSAATVGVNPVCRFYIPPEHGNSHFFSASPAECDAIKARIGLDPNYSGYLFETASAFYATLPNTTTGACPANTIPVYRLWNQRADSNHRYTTNRAIKAQMQAAGYVAEGYGSDAVIMCAPA